MKEQAIIYGAGNTGKSAYYSLKNKYDILFFVDGDKNINVGIENKKVYSPDVLKNHPDAKVIIASIYKDEILQEVNMYRKSNILIYNVQCDEVIDREVTGELDERTIDFGAFIGQGNEVNLKEMTFMIGGSRVLDYAFIKLIVEKFGCKKYLEIGTYIGESINILTDCCDELYSITADPESAHGAHEWCEKMGIPDFSNRLVYSNKIKQYLVNDSKDFDFSTLPADIDLFFIDADHSYTGIYNDTKNIFAIKKESAIVIWHDFKLPGRYRPETVRAIKDALGGEEFKNVYAVNNNFCGIYLPEKMHEKIVCMKHLYEKNEPLYTYDVNLKTGVKLPV